MTEDSSMVGLTKGETRDNVKWRQMIGCGDLSMIRTRMWTSSSSLVFRHLACRRFSTHSSVGSGVKPQQYLSRRSFTCTNNIMKMNEKTATFPKENLYIPTSDYHCIAESWQLKGLRERAGWSYWVLIIILKLISQFFLNICMKATPGSWEPGDTVVQTSLSWSPYFMYGVENDCSAALRRERVSTYSSRPRRVLVRVK